MVLRAEDRLAELIPLLESEDARLKSAALQALRRIARRRLPAAVGVWKSEVARIEDVKEYGPVDSPDFTDLPDIVPYASLAERSVAATPRPMGTVYVLIAAGCVALVVVLVYARSALIRRKAAAIAKLGKRRRIRRTV